jgi:hypothetical protein
MKLAGQGLLRSLLQVVAIRRHNSCPPAPAHGNDLPVQLCLKKSGTWLTAASCVFPALFAMAIK